MIRLIAFFVAYFAGGALVGVFLGLLYAGVRETLFLIEKLKQVRRWQRRKLILRGWVR